MDKQYRLTLTLPFKTIDDIEARLKAKNFCETLGIDLSEQGVEVKLQRIFDNKQPEKLEL